MTPPVLAPSDPGLTPHPGDALHLRRLIEQQPACLLRVGIDGLLLAVNEAALRLLGAEALTQVLGSNLTKLIIPRQHEEWHEFTARVRDGVSGSIECDLTDLSGTRRTILLQGIPLLDHADGVPSMVLSARDTSASRRLEATLREREISSELDDLQKQLQQGFSDPPRAAPPLDDRAVDLERMIAEDAAERARLLALTEEHKAALLLNEQEAQQRLDSVRTELDRALAEQQRLRTLLDDREIGHQRVVASQTAEQAQLQQALAEHQAALPLKEQEAQQRLDTLRTELDRALGEQQRLTTLLEDREIGHQRVVASQTAEQAQLQQAVAEERAALLIKEREAQQRLDGLRADLDQVLAERQRLATLVEEREASHQRVVADQAAEQARLSQLLAEEHQAALLLKEREAQHRLDDVRADLDQMLAERQQLTALLEEREASHQRAVADQAAEQARFSQTLAEEQRAALLIAEQVAQQRLDDLRTDLDQALAERQRLTTLLEERETSHQRALAEQATERARVCQTLVEEHQLALLLKERDGRQQLDKMRVELERALADRQRMLDERDTSYQQIVAQHAATRVEGEQAIAAIVAKQAAIEKALADERVELQTVQENARNLEWMAAAGRAAIAAGRELQTIVAAVDARTQHLLLQTALDADNRHVIESLRGDAIEAGSLARQILQITSEVPIAAQSSKAATTDSGAFGDAQREL